MGNYKRHQMVHDDHRNYLCQFCDSTFKRSEVLKKHELLHCGIKAFICEVCGKKFAWKEKLKQHAVIHSGMKPFMCEVCGKLFATNNYLQIHKRMHTRNTTRKHCTCNLCGTQFTCKASLKIHELVHKPFACDVCRKKFRRKPNLLRHLRCKHKIAGTSDMSVQCEVCGESIQYDRLQSHIDLRHSDDRGNEAGERKQQTTEVMESSTSATNLMAHVTDASLHHTTNTNDMQSIVKNIPSAIPNDTFQFLLVDNDTDLIHTSSLQVFPTSYVLSDENITHPLEQNHDVASAVDSLTQYTRLPC